MCGKFRSFAAWRHYIRYMDAIGQAQDDWGSILTVTPYDPAPVICLNDAGERRSVPMRWVFEGQTTEHMHARSETIDTTRAFADSFKLRRGIVLCSSFNEGEEVPTFYADGVSANNPATRQWTIKPIEPGPIAIAVIWRLEAMDGARKPAFTMATTQADKLIGKITDRMPAILRPDDWDTWLGERDAPLDEVKRMLRTYEGANEWTMEPEDRKWLPPIRRYPPGYGDDKQGSLF